MSAPAKICEYFARYYYSPRSIENANSWSIEYIIKIV